MLFNAKLFTGITQLPKNAIKYYFCFFQSVKVKKFLGLHLHWVLLCSYIFFTYSGINANSSFLGRLDFPLWLRKWRLLLAWSFSVWAVCFTGALLPLLPPPQASKTTISVCVLFCKIKVTPRSYRSYLWQRPWFMWSLFYDLRLSLDLVKWPY